MKYWTETNENITDVKYETNDVIFNIGQIEKPYPNEIYIAVGVNDETLKNGDSFVFYNFEAAKQSIINHFVKEWGVNENE